VIITLNNLAFSLLRPRLNGKHGMGKKENQKSKLKKSISLKLKPSRKPIADLYKYDPLFFKVN
jgi:hypothetical protein